MQTLVIASAGHVDHGKTALVKQITGVDTDTLAEEKSRGLTISPGFAYYRFPDGEDRVLGIVDLPGHTDFINNMLAGSAAVDGAMLVVAADDGIMPQTREHLAILDLLGLNCGLAVVSKIDRVDAGRVDEVSSELKTLLASTALASIPVFSVSNTDGVGIDEVRACLANLFAREQHDDFAPFQPNIRYLVDRSFVVKGVGTVVTGGVRNGRITRESKLVHGSCQPIGRSSQSSRIIRTSQATRTTQAGQAARVKGLRLDQQEVSEATAGSRVALNINLPHDKLHRGDWLMDEILHWPVSRLDVQLRLIDSDSKLRPAAEYHLHIGASHRLVHVRPLGNGPYHQLISTEPLFACYGDRFIIRDPSSQHTLGGGRVIDVFVPRRGRATEARLAELEALDNEHNTALGKLLELRDYGVNLNEFALCRNLSPASLLDVVQKEKAYQPHRLLPMPHQTLPQLLHERVFNSYRKQILTQLEATHISQPDQQGLSEPALGRATAFKGSHTLFQAILAALLEDSSVSKTGTLYHLPEHKAQLSAEQKQFLARIRPILLEAGKVAPRTRELVALTNIPLNQLQHILRQTTRAGSLIQVADNRHYLPETIMELAAFTETLTAQAETGGFTVIQFRDASGIGRNLCIEILEYFDRVGYTRRDGNNRFLRTDSANVFSQDPPPHQASPSA
ncbi:MAG: selenocysteine-specific translation elongation factor [Pseudohongiellaceae bacterium]